MKLNEIEVILFDLGNVLIEIDFSRVISEWQRFSGKNNIEVTKDSILGRTNEKYERDEISTAQFIESLKKELDLDITDEEVLRDGIKYSLVKISELEIILIVWFQSILCTYFPTPRSLMPNFGEMNTLNF